MPRDERGELHDRTRLAEEVQDSVSLHGQFREEHPRGVFLRRLDPVRFEPYSAGANPRGHVNPYVIELLRDGYHIDATSARSESWEEFKGVKFDFVITVCDKARESCPVWPGQPIIAHWGSKDPDEIEGEEAKKKAIKDVAIEIYRRLGIFTALPLASLDRLRLEELTKAIGKQ